MTDINATDLPTRAEPRKAHDDCGAGYKIGVA